MNVIIAIIFILPVAVWANHIQVGTVTFTDQNTTSDYIHLKFNISWDNSWRTSSAPNNWDAAWVFVKWKLHSDTEWKHCTLSTTDLDHTAPSGSTIDATAVGVFIYRNADGTGSVNWSDVKLRWNYGTDGVADDATVDVKVFAIEMVYIPQGPFILYSGESGDLKCNFNSGNTIDSEDETEVELGTITWAMEDYWGGAQTNNGSTGGSADLCGGYPKGYGAIYCMKYEISQGQYADFLNMLTSTQDGNRSIQGEDNYTYFRGTISGSAGSHTASGPNRACNFLQWADGLAYADWAGLRPMTELEYEKICRGPETADTDYAWGSTTISGLETGTGTRYQENSGYDAASSSIDDNCHYDNSGSYNSGGGPYGPVRCGSFATGSTNRQQSGASYYGVMEMSGNLWERCITVAKYCWNSSTWNNETGAGSFDGLHGNGSLSTTGFADVSNWPSPTVTSGQTAFGSSFRGAGWGNPTTDSRLRVSHRDRAANANAIRYGSYGFRAVRTP